MTAPEIEIALASPAGAVSVSATARPMVAVRIFRGVLIYTCAMTLIWLFFVITQRDGGLLFGNYNINLNVVLGWSAFKFIMVPLGIQLTTHFPPSTYGALFGFIWISYQVSDTLSEIVGSLLGKQKLRVWGIGEVNRKSGLGPVSWARSACASGWSPSTASRLPGWASLWSSPSRTPSSSCSPRVGPTTSRWPLQTPSSAGPSASSCFDATCRPTLVFRTIDPGYVFTGGDSQTIVRVDLDTGRLR